ncbi:armadillo-type protein [Mucor mucedo]|uniref:armadillo-type protein n=1 Tax=Mucor mucedo TaxID=29922 RepID=UPI00221F9A6D|nr:armadillo-type protein [Mucor mucedo]KAI7864015.1 armadillo-type protein [Mucor mucedo]
MAQQDERIGYFSTLCQELYNPKSANERDQVQKILEASFPTFASDAHVTTHLENMPSFHIQNPTDTANALRILLENSPNPYVQTFALSRLKQLVMAQFTLFDNDTKLQLRTFLLEYAYIHPDLQPFVITQLATVLAVLTRFGWLEIDEYQNVYKDMAQFLQASAEHRIVGVQILAMMVQDMNSPTIPKYAAKFRKAAAGLRDTQLFEIFENAFQLLQAILSSSLSFDKPGQEDRTKDAVLNLLLRCLSYDFAGTSLDEAGDDTNVVQIPASWRSMYEKDDFIPTFFSAYRQFNPSHASKVMECLVQIAATRKALFSGEDKRSDFVQGMMTHIGDIILTSQGMNDPDCYNGFCRLLHRFRTTAQLNEMAEKPGYLPWIELVADFTQKAFAQQQPMTCFYLLSFWARIVTSMAYYQQLGEDTVLKLEEITVALTRTFMTTYIEFVPARIEEMLDDPLDDQDELIESLTMLGQIARCKYEKSCAALFEIFDPITVHYQEFMNQASMGTISGENLKEAIEIFEAKFAWMVYIMAVFVGNRPPYLSSDENDELDGQLTTKVIQLMQVNQNLVSENRDFQSEKLDAALVYFFTQFRKSYVGETNTKPVYKKLNEVFEIEGQTDMLNLIMNKIITNLQMWGSSESIIKQSLELFHDLASGYSALKNLRKIDATTLIMQNHLSNDFSFFNHAKHRQSRMLYYQVLCKILFAEDNCEAEFYEFMKPFEVRLDHLSTLSTIEEFRQPGVQNALVEVFRDLRAFIQPIQSRKNYLLFFHWFYPDYMPVLLKGISAWSPDPSVNTLLKFFEEFVSNKSQRLNLDVSSANGVLIFRDASQILCTHGQRIVGGGTLSESDKYPVKYKGMATCFNLLGKCLGGKYINFGVFWLYGDKAVNEAYSIMFQMMLDIPLYDMMNYPKLAKAFFFMLDEFSAEQMMMDPGMPGEAFLYILQACEEGVESNDSWIRTHACSTVNNICTFVLRETEKAELRHEGGGGTEKKKTEALKSPCLNYLSQYPHLLPKLLTTLFGLILFDENNDQWQLSRPLYSLVLLDRDFAAKYTNQVILQQLPERREFVTKALSNLMDGSGWTLSTKDRERFYQQVQAVKRLLNSSHIVLVPLVN